MHYSEWILVDLGASVSPSKNLKWCSWISTYHCHLESLGWSYHEGHQYLFSSKLQTNKSKYLWRRAKGVTMKTIPHNKCNCLCSIQGPTGRQLFGGVFSNRELTANTLKEYRLALILMTAFKIISSAKELNVHSTNLILPALPLLMIPATFTSLRMEDHATTSDK